MTDPMPASPKLQSPRLRIVGPVTCKSGDAVVYHPSWRVWRAGLCNGWENLFRPDLPSAIFRKPLRIGSYLSRRSRTNQSDVASLAALSPRRRPDQARAASGRSHHGCARTARRRSQAQPRCNRLPGLDGIHSWYGNHLQQVMNLRRRPTIPMCRPPGWFPLHPRCPGYRPVMIRWFCTTARACEQPGRTRCPSGIG
jgi:hypothetical protein